MSFTLGEAIALVESIERVISYPKGVTDLQDDSLRRRLREAGRKLSLSMEVPGDTIHRIPYAVSHWLPMISLDP